MKYHKMKTLSGLGIALSVSISAYAIEVTGSGSINSFTNLFQGECFFSYRLGAVRGIIDDGGTQDQFRVVITQADGTVIMTNGSNPGPINIGPYANRTQRVGSTNTAYSVGGWFFDPLTAQFPFTMEMQERSNNTQIDGTIKTEIITRADFVDVGSPCFPSNQAPIANAGVDQNNITVGTSVTLDGTASSDPDGDTLTYNWSQVSGPAVVLDDVTLVTPSFTLPTDAATTPIVFQLLVNDGTVDSSADTVTITGNDLPLADAGEDQSTLRPSDVVILDGSGSSDPDGDALTYMWTQVSGPAVTLDDATAVSPTFTLPSAALDTPIVFQLVVSDGFVNSAADTVAIMAINDAPLADAGEDQADLRPDATVTLDGSGSSDPEGDALTYLWTQISGPAVILDDATSINPTFTLPETAIATPIVFQLVVNDGFVNSAADTVMIMAANEAPEADAGTDQTNIIPGATVTLDGTSSSDPDGDALTYMWTQVSGPTTTLDDQASATPSFIAPAGGGAIVFELIVNDGYVNSEPDSVMITVQDNIAVTSKAIGDYLTARNSLILSHQPDMQRRIDRLQGRDGGNVFLSGNGAQASSDLSGKLSFWGEAYLSDFTIDGKDGDFNIYYLGGDYLLSKDMIVGVLGQFDSIDYDSNVVSGVLDGDGWMAGPYMTARLSENLFMDARAAYGQSDNTVSPFATYSDEFETSRYLLAGSLTGEYEFGETIMVRPEGGITYLSEKSDSYVDSLGSTIPSQTVDQGQIHLAPRFHFNLNNTENMMIRPFAEARGIYSFGDNVDRILGSETRLRIEGGLDVFSQGGFRGSASYYSDGIGADNFKVQGFKLTGAVTF